VSIVIAMDHPTVIKVLEYHLNWFEVTGFTEKQVSFMDNEMLECVTPVCAKHISPLALTGESINRPVKM